VRWLGDAKTFQMALAFDEPMAVEHPHGFVKLPGKRCEIDNAFVHFHP